METIRAYIEQMFKDLPKTKEVVEMKLNIQDHMEDKYQELINEGMNEASASREVINEFGDINEILKELNIDVDEETNESEKTIRYLSDEEVDEYLNWKNTSGTMIAVGVAICINTFGISQFVGTIIRGRLGNILTGIVFFAMIACAVLIFIYFGARDEAYQNIEKNPNIQPHKKAELEKEYVKHKTKLGLFIGIGVVLCIMAVAIYSLIAWLLGYAFATLILCMLVSVGVFMFVKIGIEEDGYELFLKDKKGAQDNPIYGVIMLSATAIYLLLGFLAHMWHPGWIIFPISGILCGIVSSIAKKE